MKYTIITGATGGIGTAVANTLADEGKSLILIDVRDPSEFAVKLMERGVDVKSLVLDIANYSELGLLDALVTENQLEIEGLVHLAGITRDKTLLKMDPNDWDLVIRVNLTGTFNMVQCASKYMQPSGGSILVTGSTSALYGNYGQVNYVASKGGAEAMMKTSARELARYHIRVNCLIPGFIETPMSAAIPEEQMKRVIQSIPLGRVGKPQDVANLVSFLMSDKASYITGSSFKIDGGLRI